MNLRIYINEVMSSLRTVGVRQTVGPIVGTLIDYRFDRQHEIDAATWVPLSELAVLGDNARYGQNYQPLRVAPLRTVLRERKIPSDTTELLETARSSLERVRLVLGSYTRVAILHLDVLNYAVENNDSVFYLSNPRRL